MTFSEHRFTSRDGLSLYYRSYDPGADGRSDVQPGPVVLCLPGLTRNSKDFHDLATHLVNQPGGPWRVICPDLRGRGQSDRDRNYHHYHPATYVRDTWRLLDQAGIDQVIIVGTSLGGLMAMIMAAQQARRLVAKPGLTCLWQVSGRSQLDFEEWMALDQEYVRRRSFAYDVEILLRTLPAVIERKGAY